MKQYILAFGATLLLSGCGIYTRYEAQTTVPDNLYGDEAETVATDTVGLGDIGWRDFFSDPYLQELIERGLAQNTDVLTAGLTHRRGTGCSAFGQTGFPPVVRTGSARKPGNSGESSVPYLYFAGYGQLGVGHLR